MYFLLFLFYFLLCTWLIGRWSFFRDSGIPVLHLRIYFALKVAAGSAYGYYFARWKNGADTWSYHRDGLMETGLLRHHPIKFFTTLLPASNHNGFAGFFATRNSWWNDLDANTIPKLLGLCNLATGNSYYCNVVLLNMLFFAGPVLLLRSWRIAWRAHPNGMHYLPFLVPSFLFWCSGIHKEGFLVLAVSMIVVAVAKMLEQNSWKWPQILQFLSGFLIILALRNFLLVPIAATIAAWVIVVKRQWKPAPGFGGTLLAMMAAVFVLAWIFPSINPAVLLANKRAAFEHISAESKITLPPLLPTFRSLLNLAPEAFTLGMFRPFPADVFNLSSAMAAADQILFLAATVVCLGAANSLQKGGGAHSVAFLVLFLMVVLIIGYTVPVIGAVVRYRTVFVPLWLLGCMGLGTQMRKKHAALKH